MDFIAVNRNSSSEDTFTFSAKARCTSSRAHIGGHVVLIVCGIPGLKKPLISVPFTLVSRYRKHSKLSSPTSHVTTVPCTTVSKMYDFSQTKTPNPESSSTPTFVFPMCSQGSLPEGDRVQLPVDSRLAHQLERLPPNTVATASVNCNLITYSSLLRKPKEVWLSSKLPRSIKV